MSLSFLITLLVIFITIAIYLIVDNQKNKGRMKPSVPKTPSPTIPLPTSNDTNSGVETGSNDVNTGAAAVYNDRKGYDSGFVSTKDFSIPLSDLLKNQVSKLTPLDNPQPTNKYYLKYHHFSVVMHKERKMPFMTAVNIDGAKLVPIKRTSDSWHYDPRIPKTAQLPKAYYAANDLDLGHLVRRLDPDWGDIALKADDDTFHLTVCAPQHKNLNRVTWLSLEDYILENTDVEDLKVSVFTGPVFTNNDYLFHDVLLPLQFWKMVAIIKSNGKPSVTAYLLSHAQDIEKMQIRGLIGDEGFSEYKTYQISLHKLADLTHLHLDNLYNYDPLSGQRGLLDASHKEINSMEDLKL